jgi:YD repeat-containing protein
MKRLKLSGISRSLLIPAILSSPFLFGQGAVTNNNILYNKTPQISSPNAAALEKYVEFPTAAYTGVPDISIPIYSLGIKGVQVPIGLSYHASGIKVDEVSSDIGTGWSLLAGGAVSILPNGIMDEVSGFPNIGAGNFDKIKNNTLQSGYTGGVITCTTAELYNDPITDPDPYGLYSGGDIALLGGVIRETHDTEADVYSFNIPGKAGKFFLDETGVYRTIPYSEVKIERLIVSSFPAGYKITDETGNIFEFTIREESIEMQVNAASSFHPSQKTTRTYYLTKITNAYSEVIDFYYSSYNATYDLQKSFSRSRTPIGTPCWQMNASGSYFSNNWTYGTMTIIGQRLDSIRSSDGSLVKFGYSATNRTDFSGSKALNKIELWQYFFGRKKLRETTLTQSYSGGRLVLNSVQETGKPATSFTYNGTLPVRLSFSQDHFGYYNGKSNSTLLPADEYNEFPDGADRSVDATSVKAGVLTKVNHPTGGYTEYDYESNDFYISTTTTTYQKAIGASLLSQPNQTTSVNFSVPANATKIFMNHTNSYDGSEIHNDYCIIHLTGPNGYSQDFLGNTQPNTPYMSLTAGQYTLSIENFGTTYSAEAMLTWFQSVSASPHHELGGGLRIKEIRKYESNGVVSLSRKFEYKKASSTESSGIISNYPVYISYSNQNLNKQGEGANPTTCTSMSCQLTIQSSGSVSPVLFANGSSVLYSEVVTYLKDKTQNGYTYFKFNISDYGFNMSSPSFPYAPRIPYDWVNGSLLEQHDYSYVNSQYVLVKKQKNYYNYDQFVPATHTTHQYATYGTKVAIVEAPFICWSVCHGNVIGTTISSIYFGLHPYKLYSSWHKLIKTEETVYSLTGTQPYTTTTEYFNDNINSIQTDRVETKNSKGETFIQRLKYPKDYSSYGFVQYLLSRNVVAVPIEKYQIIKDVSNNQFVTGGEITTFKPSSVLPDKIYRYETFTPIAIGSFTASTMNSSGQLIMDVKYKEKASFTAYNSIGNITELQKKDDVPQSYIWDYAAAKPIAQVFNARQNEIFFDGFEMTAGGYWNGSMVYDYTKSHTGLSSGRLDKPSAGELVSHSTTWLNVSLSANTEYTYSGWVYSSGPEARIYFFMKTPTETGYFSVVDAAVTNVTNKWVFLQKKFTVPANITQLNIRADNGGGGTVWFDDIRLHPSAAQMTTYTYDHMVGVTSQADLNNRVIHYEYDGLGRLVLVRDQDRNILKKICYNYAGQVEDCGVTGP